MQNSRLKMEQCEYYVIIYNESPSQKMMINVTPIL